MDISLDIGAAEELFKLSREAVIGIKDNKICFSNPAAQEKFSLRPGQDVQTFFPPELIPESENACGSLTIGGVSTDIAAVKAGDITLLYLSPQEKSADTPQLLQQAKTVRTFSESLMGLKMALDAVLKHCRSDGDPRVNSYTAVLYRDYYRLQRLCSHLSAVSNIAADTLPCNKRIVDLSHTLKDLVESVDHFSAALGITVSFRAAPGSFRTEADNGLIETMMLNLISNSLLHCKQGGKVEIELSQLGKQFVITVADDGDGIRSDTLGHIFDGQGVMDMSDSLTGTGLGLAVAKGIAERHGGSMILESTPGEGCHIKIAIPISLPTVLSFSKVSRPYLSEGAGKILTELSVVLPESFYEKKYFD